jgi:acetyl-CoA acetyltransferase
MSGKVYVVGVGMGKFEQPGKNRLLDYPEMAAAAVRSALQDAAIAYDQVQHASVGYVYGDSGSGQAVLYELGLTGIPIVNVNNNCATGSTALMLAKQMIQGGLYDCTLGKPSLCFFRRFAP